MPLIVLISALVAFGCGISALLANPGRFKNQILCTVLWLVALRSYCIYRAIVLGEATDQQDYLSPVEYLRVSAAASMLLPWALWLVNDSIVEKGMWRRRSVTRSLPILIICLSLALLCLGNGYYVLGSEKLQGSRQHGELYPYINAIALLVYIWIILNTVTQIKGQVGIKRLELKFIGLNYLFSASLTILFAVVSHITNITIIRHLSHVIIIICCGISVWAVTIHKIYDTKQVLLTIIQRSVLVLLMVVLIYAIFPFAVDVMQEPPVVILCVIAAWVVLHAVDVKMRNWLDIDEEKSLAKARKAIIKIAKHDPNLELVVDRMQDYLRSEFYSNYSSLLFESEDAYVGDSCTLAKKRPGFVALCQIGWATPESLSRRRSSPGLADLGSFLSEHSLGLLLAAPRGSPNPTLLLALGTKHNEWPYTYPEVLRLQNVTELMDNILTHSRLTMQAAIQSRIEHLAMMSRGLAHDLKNLITPISAFLNHADSHLPADGTEREVHDAAQRSVHVMQDYVREALFFSEQLKPRVETVNLSQIFDEVRAITASRAADRGIAVADATKLDVAVAADSVLIQRLLANLVNNAIDASRGGQTVAFTAEPSGDGWVRIRVTDEGCGIPPEHIGRIFDPYFTTKNFGDEHRGFGLGLTICQKIVQLHHGTISIRSVPDHGTTVSVELPCQQHAESAGQLISAG